MLLCHLVRTRERRGKWLRLSLKGMELMSQVTTRAVICCQWHTHTHSVLNVVVLIFFSIWPCPHLHRYIFKSCSYLPCFGPSSHTVLVFSTLYDGSIMTPEHYPHMWWTCDSRMCFSNSLHSSGFILSTWLPFGTWPQGFAPIQPQEL